MTKQELSNIYKSLKGSKHKKELAELFGYNSPAIFSNYLESNQEEEFDTESYIKVQEFLDAKGYLQPKREIPEITEYMRTKLRQDADSQFERIKTCTDVEVYKASIALLDEANNYLISKLQGRIEELEKRQQA